MKGLLSGGSRKKFNHKCLKMSHKSSGHGKAPYHFKASGQTTEKKRNKKKECSRVAFNVKKKPTTTTTMGKRTARRIYVNERKEWIEGTSVGG